MKDAGLSNPGAVTFRNSFLSRDVIEAEQFNPIGIGYGDVVL